MRLGHRRHGGAGFSRLRGTGIGRIALQRLDDLPGLQLVHARGYHSLAACKPGQLNSLRLASQ